MFVRLVLLIAFAVAIVTGAGGPADVLTPDSVGAMVETADGDPVVAQDQAPRIPMPTFHVTPVVRAGTEVARPSPEMARVFRPPRASFG